MDISGNSKFSNLTSFIEYIYIYTWVNDNNYGCCEQIFDISMIFKINIQLPAFLIYLFLQKFIKTRL